MKAEELRIGNIVEYYITDNTDERKEWWEVTKIDVHDLESLSQTNDPDYRPIPLTEDWLLMAGFETRGDFNITTFYKGENPITKDYLFSLVWLKNNPEPFYRNGYHKIKYVHQLQNLYFALTGNELTFADPHNPCDSDDPDDRCDNCNCWKSTRSNCS